MADALQNKRLAFASYPGAKHRASTEFNLHRRRAWTGAVVSVAGPNPLVCVATPKTARATPIVQPTCAAWAISAESHAKTWSWMARRQMSIAVVTVACVKTSGIARPGVIAEVKFATDHSVVVQVAGHAFHTATAL
jgi:hypothetical protein